MAGLRDRPLIRDALLAGAVIGASAIVALIGIDRRDALHPHFAIALPASDATAPGSAPRKSSSTATHVGHSSTTRGLPRQIGFAPPSKEKKSAGDMTVVVMVPDLTTRENPGVWSDQGNAAPIVGGSRQPPALIAMSATGGISQPLTSPTGQSLPSSSVRSGAVPGTNSPAPGNPGGGGPRVRQPNGGPHSGFVLVAGGQGSSGFALSSAELFDPAKNAFAAAPSMRDARTDHTATVLPNGEILVAGGEGPSGRALASAELYDPASGKFSALTAKMGTARADHTATLISGCNCLSDGKVLIAGGSSAAASLGSTLRSAELFDPATGRFIPTGSMKSTRARHSATLIASGPLAGNVLIAGGVSDESGGDVATAELYDPATGQFAPTGRMGSARESHSATWLSPSAVSGTLSGDVLIAGGGASSAPNDSAEVFNPQTATFSPVGSMTTARTLQAAVLLNNGKVLIAGGQSSDTDYLQSAELFDPAHASFVATGSMRNLHYGATAAVLENGRALIAGGHSNWADLYDPSSGTFSSTGRMVTDLAESTSALIR
jgi:hypothetical protein